LVLVVASASCAVRDQAVPGPATGAPLQPRIAASDGFPAIPAAGMNPHQRALLALLKTEYETQPAGAAFAEGTREAWCADFVSWVYMKIGLPFDNPNSGSWRIPGVATLEDYFRGAGTFHSPGNGFTPKLGDVVMYDTTESRIWHQHTNIVLSVRDGQLTTIGGNQHGRITITTYTLTDPRLGIRGFGRRIHNPA